MSTAALLTALRERGLIAASAPTAPEEADRPWYLSLLMGLAGWIAGLFAIVFLAIVFDLDRGSGLLIGGLALLCFAWVLYFVGSGRVFVDQLALALSIAGQLAVTAFLVQKLEHAWPVSMAVFVMQLVLFAALPDRTARSLAAFFASIAWVFVLRFALRPHEGGVFFDDSGEIVAPRFGTWTPALEWLVTWMPLIVLVEWLRRTETRWMAGRAADFARPAITGLLLGLALGGIAAEPMSMLAFGFEGFGQVFNGWAIFPLLSIALALFAGYSAFALRNAGLAGLAVFAAFVHLSRFYYLYGTSLTWKSLVMLVTGLVLLAVSGLVAHRARRP